jgi:hypothetical protein
MRRRLGTGVLLVGICLTAAGPAAGQKGPGGPATPPTDYTRLIQAGVAAGKVIRIGDRGATFTLQVVENVPGGLAPPAGRGGRPKTQVTNFELDADDEVIVRVLTPPLKFDEKGKPQKYTSQELQELKGPDPNLPGYTSSFDSVKRGSLVQIKVGPPRIVLEEKGPPKKEGEGVSRPQVSMIVILQEGNATQGRPKAKTNKKK